MTNIIPAVSPATRFDIARDWLASNAPFVVDSFWDRVKRSERLDTAHFQATYGTDVDSNWKTLREALLIVAGEFLSEKALSNMEDENQHLIMHMEVSQASMLEPHEEAAVWDHWDRIDRQAAEQDRYDMYANEY